MFLKWWNLILTLEWSHEMSILPDYIATHEESIQNPEKFWEKQSKYITWSKNFDKVLDNSHSPQTKWFPGGQLNACYNAIDRHVENGKGDKIALIYDSPILKIVRKLTFLDLQKEISKLAGALANFGVKKGDVVMIYMPLVPETIMAMLATARLGATHAVVFGGFAAGELYLRIEHSKPKVLITASCGVEPTKVVNYVNLVEEALLVCSHKLNKVIVYQRDILRVNLTNERFIEWNEAVKIAKPHDCVPVDANDTLYILYTSGTTGDPKGIERPIGGHLVCLTWTMENLYGIKEDDIWWTTSDFGWVVGHSYMCYAPLLSGITSVLYEGKPTTTPNPAQYYRIINDYQVNALFTIPSIMRILKQADPSNNFGEGYNISSLRQIWFAGEHCDTETKMWTQKRFGVPVSNHWWQTETGSAITAMCKGLKNPTPENKLSVGLPVPGYNIKVFREDGSMANKHELGQIVIKLPLPPGNCSTLHKAPQRYVETYFKKYPGYYNTMDSGYMDENGLVYVTARSDDVINVAGHRLSTLALENIVLSHPDICDACVVSVPDEIKHEVPLCLFVVNKDSSNTEEAIIKDLVSMVRSIIGPVASFSLCASIRALPTTISGKICRKSISDLARNRLEKISPTVLDPTIYEDLRLILKKFNFY